MHPVYEQSEGDDESISGDDGYLSRCSESDDSNPEGSIHSHCIDTDDEFQNRNGSSMLSVRSQGDPDLFPRSDDLCKGMEMQEEYLQLIDPNIWKCGKTPSRATTRPGRAQPLSPTRGHPGTEGQLLEVERVMRKPNEPSEGVSPIGTSSGAQPGAVEEASSRSRVTIR